MNEMKNSSRYQHDELKPKVAKNIFLTLPSYIIGHKDLSVNEKLIALVLVEFCHGTQECWPKVETVAKKCNLSKRWTAKIISELAEKGIIEIEKNYSERDKRLVKYKFITDPYTQEKKVNDHSSSFKRKVNDHVSILVNDHSSTLVNDHSSSLGLHYRGNNIDRIKEDRINFLKGVIGEDYTNEKKIFSLIDFLSLEISEIDKPGLEEDYEKTFLEKSARWLDGQIEAGHEAKAAYGRREMRFLAQNFYGTLLTDYIHRLNMSANGAFRMPITERSCERPNEQSDSRRPELVEVDGIATFR